MNPELTLFHLRGCPYCHKVRRAAHRLGIPLQLVEVREQPWARELLLAARGRATVPVLRITDVDGVSLLPESDDIVAYLERLVVEGRNAA